MSLLQVQSLPPISSESQQRWNGGIRIVPAQRGWVNGTGVGINIPHAQVYENEGKLEWQLHFALSFDLTQVLEQ